MSDLENQEFRECAWQLLSRAGITVQNGQPLQMMNPQYVIDLLARAMRIASEETWEEFGPSADMLPSDYGSIAEGISSRIKGENNGKS